MFSTESNASEIWSDVSGVSALFLFRRHCNTSVNAVNHVSVPSTSARSLSDIAFFDDFVFWVALHDGQVTILSFMMYGIFLLHDLS